MTQSIATLIIGAGALGSTLAAKLHASGDNVMLVARGQRLDHIQSSGVTLVEQGVSNRHFVTCVGAAPEDCNVKRVIIATKAYDLPSVLSQLRLAALSPREIMTVQNGVEAPDMVQDAFPEAAILASRVHGFFEMDGHEVRHAGVAPEILMGPVQPDTALTQSGTQHQLANAGMAATYVRDMRPSLWEKFMLASAIGGVGAACGLPAGKLCGDATALDMLRGALTEIQKLAKTSGIHLPPETAAQTLDFIRTFPSHATSSLQRDLEAHRRSEYDHLTGAVLRFAAAADIHVPVHQRVDELIRKRGLNPDL